MKHDAELIRKNKRTGLIVLAVVAGMTALAFASVPLYSLFCRVTGFGGTTQVAETLPSQVLERTVTIKFNADKGRDMPWDFKPAMREITLPVGARGLAAFEAANPTDKPVTGTALYNVTPLKAGKYFHKIQCFCFDEQTLQPGEKVSMPVVFYIDPAFDEDPGMNEVHTITLSYTFFKTESKALEDALDGFYNEGGATP